MWGMEEEVKSVGFKYAHLGAMQKRYDIHALKDGWNTEMDESGEGEEFYFISNPALGLWAVSSRFEEDATDAATTGQNGASV